MHMEFEGPSRMDIEYGVMLIYMDIYSNIKVTGSVSVSQSV